MFRRLIVVLFLALALATVLVPSALVLPRRPEQVGLVIAFPDGTKHLEVVTVPVAATTFDVLSKAEPPGIDLVTGALAQLLCSINKVGCPATNCFCNDTPLGLR